MENRKRTKVRKIKSFTKRKRKVKGKRVDWQFFFFYIMEKVASG